MKRILSLFMIVVLSVLVAGCGSDGGETKKLSKKHSVDVGYYVKFGQMPECSYQLSYNPDSIIEDIEAATQTQTDDHDIVVNTYEEGERTLIVTGDINYYYETAKKEKGISYIVNFVSGYGFKQGDALTNVKSALESLDLEVAERDAKDGEIFYVPGNAQLSVIELTFESNGVKFVFQDGSLCACALYMI